MAQKISEKTMQRLRQKAYVVSDEIKQLEKSVRELAKLFGPVARKAGLLRVWLLDGKYLIARSKRRDDYRFEHKSRGGFPRNLTGPKTTAEDRRALHKFIQEVNNGLLDEVLDKIEEDTHAFRRTASRLKDRLL